MNFSSLLAIGSAGLTLLLSLWLFVAGLMNKSQQNKWQEQQQELMNHQQTIAALQQKAQGQQQQIQAGRQLTEQNGQAFLKDIGSAVVKNKNEKLKTLLARYGVTVQENTPAPATPGVKTTTPPTP
jgi:hypothetical protein